MTLDADQQNTLERAYDVSHLRRMALGELKHRSDLTRAAALLAAASTSGLLEWEERAVDVVFLALGTLHPAGWLQLREHIASWETGTQRVCPTRADDLEAENARLRAEVERLSGREPVADPRLP